MGAFLARECGVWARLSHSFSRFEVQERTGCCDVTNMASKGVTTMKARRYLLALVTLSVTLGCTEPTLNPSAPADAPPALERIIFSSLRPSNWDIYYLASRGAEPKRLRFSDPTWGSARPFPPTAIRELPGWAKRATPTGRRGC